MKVEFGKIVWPDKKMTLGFTGIVIVMTIIVSIYLGSVDLSYWKNCQWFSSLMSLIVYRSETSNN